jgi:SAM-dependent methyltransferase
MDQSKLYTLYDREPGPIVAFLEYVRDLYKLPRPGSVLDMGCGPGRLLAPLAGSSWSVVGYEPDPDYAESARATLAEFPNGRFRQAGFLNLDEVAAFDLIAAVNGPYSYVLEAQNRREALRRCRQALRPGGVLFLEFANFHWIFKNYREPPPAEIEVDGMKVTRTVHHDIDFHHGTFIHHDRFTWRDSSGQDYGVTKVHPMAIVSYPELAFFLADLGFENVATFNSYSDRASAELTGRRILVAAQVPRC